MTVLKPTTCVLTPTGARPEAFQECLSLMRGQTAKNITWVVVDDGPEPIGNIRRSGWNIEHIRPEPLWQPGDDHTLCRNLIAGMKRIKEIGGDKVIIVEDDDWYAPWWVRHASNQLNDVDLFGESHSVYLNVKTGGMRKCMNADHASLCSTAFTSAVFDNFIEICENNKTFVDLLLWKNKSRYRHKLQDPSKPGQDRGVLGIKGLPGRPGIGVGHRI